MTATAASQVLRILRLMPRPRETSRASHEKAGLGLLRLAIVGSDCLQAQVLQYYVWLLGAEYTSPFA